MGWSDFQGTIVGLVVYSAPLPASCGSTLDLTSSWSLSLHMPRFDNSADSPQPCQSGCFAWTSTALQASSVRTLYCRSDANASGSRNPYGLCNSLSTLHAGCSAVRGRVAPRTGKCMRSTASAQRARLDTGGWLDLVRQGLSPCKNAPSFACRSNDPCTRVKIVAFYKLCPVLRLV